MGWDIARKEQKKAEIKTLLTKELCSVGISETALEEIFKTLMDNAISVEAPVEQRQIMEMIVMNASARGGARSTKPGNIRLDLGQLLETIAGGVLTLEAVVTWWMLPFGLLVVLRSLSRNISVPLTESDAVTILAIWQASNNNNNRCAKLAEIKVKTDLHAQKHKRNLLSLADIQHSIGNLVAIGSVKPVIGIADTWKVIERLSFSYR